MLGSDLVKTLLQQQKCMPQQRIFLYGLYCIKGGAGDLFFPELLVIMTTFICCFEWM
jgi:hypothetical protein